MNDLELKKTDVIQHLKSYSVYRKMLHSQEYAKEYFDVDGTLEIVSKGECQEKNEYYQVFDRYTSAIERAYPVAFTLHRWYSC